MAMASSSPSSHPFRVPSNPPLSPVSPDSSTDSNGKKESELVQEAFGNRLWHPRKHGPPGLSSVSAARKRLSVPAQQGMPPEERLEYGGIKKCKQTEALFRNVKRHRTPGVSTSSMAKRWISNLGGTNTLSSIDELDDNNTEKSIEGASFRFFPRSVGFSHGGSEEFDDEQNEQELRQIETRIESWLSSDDVAEGFVRFFHGAASSSALTIVERGIIEGKLAYARDLGPAFYCAESLHLVMLYSNSSMEFNDSRGAAMAFDVPQVEYDELVVLRVEGPTWKTMVSLLQTGKAHEAFADHELVKVVVGCVSHDPDDAQLRPYDDERIHFAFRGNSGNMGKYSWQIAPRFVWLCLLTVRQTHRCKD
jgi:hypothetical protein